MFTARATFQKQTQKLMSTLSRKLKALPTVPRAIMTEIQDELTQTAQGELISQLDSFLDDCYLQVLKKAFDYGNTSKLRLGKFKASLSPTAYIPEEGEDPRIRDAESGQWFTVQGLISDIWHSCKFESFKQKAEMLFGACDYNVDPGFKVR
jgi:hypothetical protein